MLPVRVIPRRAAFPHIGHNDARSFLGKAPCGSSLGAAGSTRNKSSLGIEHSVPEYAHHDSLCAEASKATLPSSDGAWCGRQESKPKVSPLASTSSYLASATLDLVIPTSATTDTAPLPSTGEVLISHDGGGVLVDADAQQARP